MHKKRTCEVQPLFYNLGDKIYGGKNDLDYKVFYNRMREGEMPVTNAIIPEEMRNGLRPFLEQGYDILHLAFSSGLSSSCQNAILAANELMEEFPDESNSYRYICCFTGRRLIGS